MDLLALSVAVLGAPLVGFVAQFFLGPRLPRRGDLWTLLAIGVSLVASGITFFRVLAAGEGFRWEESATWFLPGGDPGGAWTVGFLVDGLTAVMLVVVTVVSFLVHWFSVGYMHGDPRYPWFFAWLQMFSVAMLLLVLAGNLLLLFVGWELVGLCSYKLIGFWSERPAPANAARKAFLTTRIGDLGMILALMVAGTQVGSFEFGKIGAAVESGVLSGPWLAVLGFGLLAAAVGKSAQFPLHVWLPDAMEGPTPVSALIHAATMVAAGVYLLARMAFALPPEVWEVAGAVGAFTAIFAGLIALAQDDLKKVLAYSTVSQLGYMFLGLGVGAWHAAVFHLATHACFKALLFLGSGSVIHACHHVQDTRRMGGLWRRLPLTGTTFLVGVLAIAGLPFLSGFYSKDAILSGAWHRSPVLFGAGILGAVLTAFYMARLFVRTFLGRPRDPEVHDSAHEGGPWLTVPLVVLAVLSVVVGWGTWHETLLAPPTDTVVAGVRTIGDPHVIEHSGAVAVLAVGAGLAGLALGWLFFAVLATSLDRIKRPWRGIERAFASKFWCDEIYERALLAPARALASLFARADARGVDGAVNGVGRAGVATAGFSGATDARVVDGAVRGVGAAALAGGSAVSGLQSGRLRFYLSLSVGALAATLVLVGVF